MSIDVTKLTTQQAHEMNNFGANYGMYGNDFYSLLTKDIEEKESLKLAREHEEEKAMFHVSLIYLKKLRIYRVNSYNQELHINQ